MTTDKRACQKTDDGGQRMENGPVDRLFRSLPSVVRRLFPNRLYRPLPSVVRRLFPVRLLFPLAAVAFCYALGAGAAHAQAGAADLLVRIDQLENQLRHLTGVVEEMQYRNAQLEAALKRLQDDADYRPQGGARAPAPSARSPAPVQVPTAGIPAAPPPSSGRRSDAFDPAANPNAPGAPRVLGSLYANAPSLRSDGGTPVIMAEEPTGRVAGPPLDLGAVAGGPGGGGVGGASATGAPTAAPYDAGYARGAPLPSRLAPRGGSPPGPPGATGAMAVSAAPPTLPPSSTPRDAFDLGYGYLQRRDYALAEETFRDFLRKYPSDRQAGDAQYFLGESLYQHRNYRDAADAFLAMSKKFDASAKAPDALLRLGQSLAALNEKELACATFGEVNRKYPRASADVKQSVEREQKRVRC
jgi:tol-pal system protein YbgF